jgi:hypothetical protein
MMQKEDPNPWTRAQSRRRFQAYASSQKQQATSSANHAQGPQAPQSRQQRGRGTIVASILFVSGGILCLLLLLFARDALLAGLSVFLVSLLNLAISLLCLSGFLMLFVFFLLFRLFGQAYSNPLNVNARYAQRLRRRREELMWGPPHYPWLGHGTYDPW